MPHTPINGAIESGGPIVLKNERVNYGEYSPAKPDAESELALATTTSQE